MNQESLWQFALAAYGRDGMESVCLALQDQQGININVLLWSLWLDHNAVGFDRGFWQQSVQAINAVHARVVRVRSLRRWIPKRRGLLWLRNPVKAWELRLEKSELMQLQNLTDTQGAQLQTKASGRDNYLSLCLADVSNREDWLRQIRSTLEE
jgi:uncharacterized protein (TIGR02444 family)